jgi:hypothetical protein
MTTIQELAKEAGSYFVGAKRDSGTTFRKLKDERPEWVYELVREAHGDMLPDDWRYEAIETVLEAIEGIDDPDDHPTFEPDVYNSDLYKWLSSHSNRSAYCDAAADEGSLSERASMADRLMAGQVMEYEEIYGSVIQSLRDRLDEIETEEE